jgi:micrococcal nuclease
MKPLIEKPTEKMLIATFIIAVWACPIWAKPQKLSQNGWSGVVTHVSDGDTVWVRPVAGGSAVNIRIDGIDAPEICQAGGAQAKAALNQRLLHQTVNVQATRRDGFGRLLAHVWLHQTDVGQTMVKSGHAWAHQYKRYESVYAAEQAQAKAARRGLFANANAVHPREFRKRQGACPRR